MTRRNPTRRGRKPKVFNPKTGRMISRTGTTFKKLTSQGYKFNENANYLVIPSTFEADLSQLFDTE